MTSRPRCQLGRPLLAVACLLGAGTAALAQPAGWHVLLGAGDVTLEARGYDAAGVLMVDVAGLAGALGLGLQVEAGKATVRDLRGLEWQATAGSALLRGAGATMQLAAPARIEGASAYLPAAAVARLAQLTLIVDAEEKTAYLDGAPAAGSSAPQGWDALTVPNAARRSQLPDAGSTGDDVGPPANLPPAHDVLHVGLEASRAAGGDWGTGLHAAGSWSGYDTNAYGLVTNGPNGYQPYNRYLGMVQPHGWGFEAGDLSTELFGRTEGFRWLGDQGAGGASRPAVSLYLPLANSLTPGTVLAGRDEWTFGQHAALGGEVATDGSFQASGRYQRDGLGLFGFGRQVTGTGPGMGLSGFVALPAGMDAQAAWTSSGRGEQALATRDASLRVPLRGLADLAAEVTDMRGFGTTFRAESLRLGSALGPVLLSASCDWRMGSLLTTSGFRSAFGERELRAGLAWAPSRWLRFDLSSFDLTAVRGGSGRWQQAQIALRLPTRTALLVTLSSAGSPLHEPVHFRLEQAIRQKLDVFAEYGTIASFQGTDASAQPHAGFLIGARMAWDVATPAGGGVVAGRIAGPPGGPAGGVPVELGPYRTRTDDEGGFVFRNVPPGDYALALPPSSVPAAFRAGAPGTITVAAHRTSAATIALVPLCGVIGRVYLDRDGDGRHHPGSGVGSVVVRLDDQLTGTRPDGSFEFQNVAPGTHHLSIDRDHLPAGVAVTIPSEIDLGMPPGRTLDGVELRLVPKLKAVVFQEVSR